MNPAAVTLLPCSVVHARPASARPAAILPSLGLLMTLLLMPLLDYGQRETANWYFGLSGLDFNCSPPQTIPPNPDFFPVEGSSSISDAAGNLLFYTDGYAVYDRHHQPMPNGTDIGEELSCYGSSTQGALIVKQPQQDSIYYIFTTDCAENYLANGLNYSIVNMNRNQGNGEVVVKKQTLLAKVTEKLCATRHANGTDVWILAHEWGNNKFYAYLLTASGLAATPVVSATGRTQLPDNIFVNYPECAARGQMKFSLAGDKLVVLSVSDCHAFVSYPEIFSFDKSTGAVAYQYKISTQDSLNYYAGSFSPSGNLLYLSGGWYSAFVHQFNLALNDSQDVINSRYVVYSDPLATDVPGALQIGPDGKIYNAFRSFSLSVIHAPDSYGFFCNYEAGAIRLDSVCIPLAAEFGLPNLDESLYQNTFTGTPCTPVTYVDFTYQDSCDGIPIQFTDTTYFFPYRAQYWEWNFGDPASGVFNTSQQRNPQHTFANPGTYLVKLVAYSDMSYQCQVDSVSKVLKLDCSNALPEPAAAHTVTLYPNPVRTAAVLEVNPALRQGEIRVENALGQTVLHRTALRGNRIVLQREELPEGVYFLRLMEGGEMLAVHKMVVAD